MKAQSFNSIWIVRSVSYSVFVAMICIGFNEAMAQSIDKYELSGPLFALMSRLSVDTTLEQVDYGVSQRLADGSAELDAVITTAADFGIDLESYTVDPGSPTKIPTPCLMVREEVDAGAVVKALVLVEGRNKSNDALWVYEFRKGRGWLEIDDSSLESQFKGEILSLPAKRFPYRYLLIGSFLFLGASLVLRRIQLNQSNPAKQVALILFAAILVHSTGCEHNIASNNNNPTKSDFVDFDVDPVKVDLGTIPDEDKIRFQVAISTASEFIHVDSVVTDCGCLQHEKESSTEKVASFLLAPGSQVGQRKKNIRIVCASKTGLTKTKTIPVFYKVVPRPKIEPADPVAIRYLSENEYRTEVVLVCRRLAIETPIEIDWAKSELAGFEGANASRESFTYLNTDIKEDRNFATLRCDSSLAHSDEDRDVTFVLTNGRKLKVNIRNQAIHPLNSELDRLFLGVTKVGSAITKTVVVTNESNADITLSNVTFLGPAKLICEIPQPRLKPTESIELELKFDVGDDSGRGEGEICIATSNPSIVPIKIATSWINNGK